MSEELNHSPAFDREKYEIYQRARQVIAEQYPDLVVIDKGALDALRAQLAATQERNRELEAEVERLKGEVERMRQQSVKVESDLLEKGQNTLIELLAVQKELKRAREQCLLFGKRTYSAETAIRQIEATCSDYESGIRNHNGSMAMLIYRIRDRIALYREHNSALPEPPVA
jgi:chromosome segregation ATPase